MSKLVVLLIVLVIPCGAFAQEGGSSPGPQRIELAQKWSLISAKKTTAAAWFKVGGYNTAKEVARIR